MSRKRINLHLGYVPALKRWRKRIDGKVYYFGPSGCDEDTARKALLAFLTRREAGVSGAASNAISVGILAEIYAQAFESRVAKGSALAKTWKEYDRAIAEFVAAVGADTLVSNLGAQDFADVREDWKKRLSPLTLMHRVAAVRTMFQWAKDNNRLLALPNYGKGFAGPSKNDRRQHKARVREKRGDRKFTPAELKAIFAQPECTGIVRSCVLLALNCGFYSIDCADLTWGDIKHKGAVTLIERERRKTGIDQRCPLWPEVVEAIEEQRKPGAKPDDRIFTQPNGSPLSSRHNDTDWLHNRFSEVYDATGLKRPGIGFGALKHTHVSGVGELGDQIAKLYVRGHKLDDEDVGGTYDMPDLKRLKAITDHARRVLYLRNVKKKAPSRARAHV